MRHSFHQNQCRHCGRELTERNSHLSHHFRECNRCYVDIYGEPDPESHVPPWKRSDATPMNTALGALALGGLVFVGYHLVKGALEESKPEATPSPSSPA